MLPSRLHVRYTFKRALSTVVQVVLVYSFVAMTTNQKMLFKSGKVYKAFTKTILSTASNKMLDFHVSTKLERFRETVDSKCFVY